MNMKKLGRPNKNPPDLIASGVTASLDRKSFDELEILVEILGIRRATLFRRAIHQLLNEHRAAIDAVSHEKNVHH
jgi:hypothetical protein